MEIEKTRKRVHKSNRHLHGTDYDLRAFISKHRDYAWVQKTNTQEGSTIAKPSSEEHLNPNPWECLLLFQLFYLSRFSWILYVSINFSHVLNIFSVHDFLLGCFDIFSHSSYKAWCAGGGHCTSRARLHVRARILNRRVHVPIVKPRKYDITFGRITFIFVFVASWRNSWSSRIYQKCAPGHQARKTTPDDASGADFQVGFWWASNWIFFMLLSSTTRPFAWCVRQEHQIRRTSFHVRVFIPNLEINNLIAKSRKYNKTVEKVEVSVRL